MGTFTPDRTREMYAASAKIHLVEWRQRAAKGSDSVMTRAIARQFSLAAFDSEGV